MGVFFELAIFSRQYLYNDHNFECHCLKSAKLGIDSKMIF